MPLDFSGITAVLFDMDGVLYRGTEALPGVNELLGFLEAHDRSYACVTNNAARTSAQVAARLEAMGITVPADRIMTSSMATNLYLRSVAPRGTPVLAVGMAGLHEPLFGDGYFVPAERDPRFVVVGLDFELSYAKLRAAGLAIRAGATFVGTNPDTTYPTEDGLAPGCGAILAALEAATDQQPLVIGKPAPAMFEAALDLLGVTGASTLMVGDRYDTDIRGAAEAGLHTAMVLTGVSARAEAEAAARPPDLIVADLPALLDAWRAALT